jgi:hypothetical protein
MSSDAKSSTPAHGSSTAHAQAHGQGVRIFTYPKVIFIFPTMIAALICGLGMILIRDETDNPTKPLPPRTAAAQGAVEQPMLRPEKIKGFTSTQNILSMVFLAVFAFNMMIMSLDFPRFTLIAVFLLIFMVVFFFLWLNAYYDLVPPLVKTFEHIYAVANAQFYFLLATIIFLMLGVIYVTRWLDYWQIMPNEILHHHGPLSDLERFPTLNLKFDKEIPDVLEHMFLGAGRLVLHPQGEQKSIMLDNVLFINRKEDELKKLLSRLEVRVTTDKEVEEET